MTPAAGAQRELVIGVLCRGKYEKTAQRQRRATIAARRRGAIARKRGWCEAHRERSRQQWLYVQKVATAIEDAYGISSPHGVGMTERLDETVSIVISTIQAGQ